MKKKFSAYRADIDGLRAVAVMLVVLYHSEFRYLPGGYVGVDVFFVISGYLITLHIASELEADKFSLNSFYERRVRRIFPALLGMLVVATALAYFYMLPGEVEDYAKSLISAAFSVSNLYFWRQSGYFDAPATMKPLLHTWSLAVEEQFYVFFPLVLMALRKYAWKRAKLVVSTIAILSFLISLGGPRYYPTANFYLAPGRAWELLVGSLIALEVVPRFRGRAWREIGAAVGLLLIFYAAIRYTASTPFPGFTALAPCIGAGLIIACGIRDADPALGQSEDTMTARMLSLKPIVFLGLISYSLYLWHWPVIVFEAIVPRLSAGHILVAYMPFLSVHHAYTVERIVLILGTSIVLATLSWQFIEKPFRAGALRMSQPSLFRFFGVTTAAMVCVAAVIIYFRGFPKRFSPETLQVASYLSTLPGAPLAHYHVHSCFLTSSDTLKQFDRESCLHIDPEKKNWLLIGDSHAAHLDYGLAGLDRLNVLQATAAGCKPVMADKSGENATCVALNRFIFGEYLPQMGHQIDTVAIAARWDSGDLDRLGDTVRRLKAAGLHVLLFGPIMEYDTPLPRLLALSIQDGDPGLAAEHRLLSYDALDEDMKRLAQEVWKVDYVSYEDDFCKAGRCLEYASKGVPLQSDTAHLTEAGSVLVAQRIKPLAN